MSVRECIFDAPHHYAIGHSRAINHNDFNPKCACCLNFCDSAIAARVLRDNQIDPEQSEQGNFVIFFIRRGADNNLGVWYGEWILGASIRRTNSFVVMIGVKAATSLMPVVIKHASERREIS